MDFTGTVPLEQAVSVSSTVWTLLVPSDSQRIWLGLQPTAAGSTIFVSLHSGGTGGQGGVLPSSISVVPAFKLTLETDGPMVWQEWWARSGAGIATILVWTIRRISYPARRQTPGGILLPGRNGYQSSDGLDSVDRPAMEVALSQLRQQTRKVQNAQR